MGKIATFNKVSCKLFSRSSPFYTNVSTILLLHISPVSSRFTNLEDLAFALVQTVHSWQFQRCIPLLGIVLFTHMLRSLEPSPSSNLFCRVTASYQETFTKLSCSMVDCLRPTVFPIIVAYICLLSILL